MYIMSIISFQEIPRLQQVLTSWQRRIACPLLLIGCEQRVFLVRWSGLYFPGTRSPEGIDLTLKIVFESVFVHLEVNSTVL